MGKKIRDLRAYLLENSVLDLTTGCRSYTGSIHKGYGRLKYRGKAMRVNRLAYAIAQDIDVDDVDGDVLQSCGNRLCIEPSHLHLGKCNEKKHLANLERARLTLAAGTKCCSRCSQIKPLAEFNKNIFLVDGYQCYCRTCDNAHRRKWYRKPGSAASSIVYNARKRKQQIEWFRSLKSKLRCERCGETHPSALDFHNRDPNQKEFGIAGMIRRTLSMKRIKAEIDKCIVLCANCHRKLHYEEKFGPIAQWESTPLSTERPGIVTP
jgi:hypothetical protein